MIHVARSILGRATALALLGAWLGAGCAAEGEAATPTAHDEIIHGRRESGYPAVGFMMWRSPSEYWTHGPQCGATLIHPRAAVTAAHCAASVRRAHGSDVQFGIVFGPVGSPDYYAHATLAHPAYDGNAGFRHYRHDVAVLLFASPIAGVEPAVRVRARTGCQARAIGYGRTQAGPFEGYTGPNGERRSAAQCVDHESLGSIFATGQQSGLCWGDSGGPLVNDGTNEVLGVLAEFNYQGPCREGGSMIFTSLDAEREFVDAAIRALPPSVPIVPGVPTVDQPGGSWVIGEHSHVFAVPLTGAQVVPPVATAARGSAEFHINGSGDLLAYKITHDVPDATGVSLHVGARGVGDGERVLDLGAPGSPVLGVRRLTPDLLRDVLGARLYLEVRSARRPAGEIRGQVQTWSG